MTIYVTVAMEDGINRTVDAFAVEESAKQHESAWLQSVGIETEADRKHAPTWSTRFAIWKVNLKP